METKKVLGVIFSLIFVGLFIFVLTWGVINFNKVKDGMSGTGIYTEQDINSAYEDGYNTALNDKDEYNELINSYRDTITTQTDQISQLKNEVNTLTNQNKDYTTQIENLTAIKQQNEETITNLEITVSENEKTIETLETDKTNLQIQVDDLLDEVADKESTIRDLMTEMITLQEEVDILTAMNDDMSAEIEILNGQIDDLEADIIKLNKDIRNLNDQIDSLKSQISNLETLNGQLEDINEINLSNIATLNSQIQSLNTQIANLIYASQNSSTIINNLHEQIADLQESIAYYEQVITNLTGENQVAVTFEFDGSVYNVQIVSTGSVVTVTTPVSTDYVIFNYWTVDGEQIDLNSYVFNESTTVVADVTYKYDVKFMVDNEEYNSQVVSSGDYATLPSNPTKTGYEFDGWSIDGVNIVSNIETTAVTSNVTYKAVFTGLYTVTFVYEDDTISTQLIRNGSYATSPEVEDTTYKIFNGWLVNSTSVNVDSYKIVGATVFVADITYKYDVTFMVDNEEYNTQIITSGNYATTPTAPTKTGYTFKGWTKTENGSVVNLNSTAITSETTFYAVFEINTYTVTFKNGSTTVNTQSVEYNDYASALTSPTKTGYTFKGWSLSEGGSVISLNSKAITGNTTFYAIFEINSYTVTFKNGSTTVSIQSVDYNAYASVPTSPTKTGYIFKGWSRAENGSVVNINSVSVTSNLTFYAIFEINTYTVTFMVDDSIYTTQNVDYNNYASIDTNPAKDAYTFKGWSIDGSNTIELSSYAITQNVTLIAVFEYVGSWHSVFESSENSVQVNCSGSQNAGSIVGTATLKFNSTESMSSYSIENIRITVTISLVNGPYKNPIVYSSRDIVINGSSYIDDVTGTLFTYTVNDNNEVKFNSNRVLNLPDGCTMFEVTNIEVFY